MEKHALDTNALIALVRRDDAAADYRKHVSREKVRILVPAPVLFEACIGDPMLYQEQPEFITMPLSFRASVLGAAFMREARNRSNGEWEDCERCGRGNIKQKLKLDAMILACAVAEGATDLVTANVADFAKFGDIPIRVRPMSAFVVQTSLFSG